MTTVQSPEHPAEAQLIRAAAGYTGLMSVPAAKDRPAVAVPLVVLNYPVGDSLAAAASTLIRELGLPLVTTCPPATGWPEAAHLRLNRMGTTLALRVHGRLLATVPVPQPRWRAAVATYGNRALLLAGVGRDVPPPGTSSRALYTWLTARVTRGWFHAGHISVVTVPRGGIT